MPSATQTENEPACSRRSEDLVSRSALHGLVSFLSTFETGNLGLKQNCILQTREHLSHLRILLAVHGLVSLISTSVAPNLQLLSEHVFHVVGLVMVQVGGGAVHSLVATAVLCSVEDIFLGWLDLHLDNVEWQKEP